MNDSAVIDYLAPDGVLRASINLGNPVLAQGSSDQPRGVTVDIARELATRLSVDVRFTCFDAARHSFHATRDGVTDLCFLAIEPAREGQITFTAPYALIEGVFAVASDSPTTSVEQVDRPGVRIGVKQGSAYDLYLSRTLAHAVVVRGTDGIDAFRTENLDVAAGIRGPIEGFVAIDPDVRMLDQPFMQIRQALGMRRDAPPACADFLYGFVEELKASGFVAASLQRSGQAGVAVAPAQPR